MAQVVPPEAGITWFTSFVGEPGNTEYKGPGQALPSVLSDLAGLADARRSIQLDLATDPRSETSEIRDPEILRSMINIHSH